MRGVRDISNFQQFTAINVLADPGHIGGPVVIPNSVKFMIVWNMPDGKVARNVLGMNVAGAFNPTPAAAEAGRAALVGGGTWTALAGFLAPTCSLAAVELLDIRTPNNAVVRSTGAAAPGTSAGTALPSEVAAAATIRTNRAGPGFRGRFYIPGFASNAQGTGDTIAAAAVTAINGWVQNTVGAAIAAVPGQWVLLQPARAQYTGSTGTLHPARPAGSVIVTTAICRDNHWDSQRRRGLK